jgi:hypothetical protein
MTQDQVITLLFKVVLISGALSVLLFVAVYTWYAPWWRDEIGRTIVVKDILIAIMLVPTILSLFFEFTRLSSRVAAWVDIGLFGLLTPVMLWRCVVWRRIHRGEDRQPPSSVN